MWFWFISLQRMKPLCRISICLSEWKL
jgi:hypothetical protein